MIIKTTFDSTEEDPHILKLHAYQMSGQTKYLSESSYNRKTNELSSTLENLKHCSDVKSLSDARYAMNNPLFYRDWCFLEKIHQDTNKRVLNFSVFNNYEFEWICDAKLPLLYKLDQQNKNQKIMVDHEGWLNDKSLYDFYLLDLETGLAQNIMNRVLKELKQATSIASVPSSNTQKQRSSNLYLDYVLKYRLNFLKMDETELTRQVMFFVQQHPELFASHICWISPNKKGIHNIRENQKGKEYLESI